MSFHFRWSDQVCVQEEVQRDCYMFKIEVLEALNFMLVYFILLKGQCKHLKHIRHLCKDIFHHVTAMSFKTLGHVMLNVCILEISIPVPWKFFLAWTFLWEFKFRDIPVLPSKKNHMYPAHNVQMPCLDRHGLFFNLESAQFKYKLLQNQFCLEFKNLFHKRSLFPSAYRWWK